MASSPLSHLNEINTEVASAEAMFLGDDTRSLFRWWSSFRSQGMPRKRDFDISQHWSIAPRLYLVDVIDADTYRFRLQGEEVIHMVGRWRGVTIAADGAGDTDSAFYRDLCNYYRTLTEDGFARRCAGPLDFVDKRYMLIESVDCPLFDDDGRVAHIIGVMQPIGQNVSGLAKSSMWSSGAPILGGSLASPQAGD